MPLKHPDSFLNLQRAQQGSHKLDGHLMQLLQEDTEAFISQEGDVVSVVCPDSAEGSPQGDGRMASCPDASDSAF